MIISLHELEAFISELEEGVAYVDGNVDVNAMGMLQVLDQFDTVAPGLERAFAYTNHLIDDFHKNGVCRTDMETLYSLPGLEKLEGKLPVGHFTARKSTVNLEVALEQANAMVGIIVLAWVAIYVAMYAALVKFLSWVFSKIFKSDSAAFEFLYKFASAHGGAGTDVPFKTNLKALSTLKVLKMNNDFLADLLEAGSENLNWYAGEVDKLESAMTMVFRVGRVGDSLKKLLDTNKSTAAITLMWSTRELKLLTFHSKLATFCGCELDFEKGRGWAGIKIADWEKQTTPTPWTYTHSELEVAGILQPAQATEKDFKALVDGAENALESLTTLNDRFDGKAFEIEREVRKDIRNLMEAYKKVGSEVRAFVGVSASYATAYINLRMKVVRHFGKALESAGPNYRVFISCVEAFIDALRKGEKDSESKEVNDALSKFDASKKQPSHYAELAAAAQAADSKLFAEICAKRGVASWIISAITDEAIPVDEERLLLSAK